MTTLSSDTIENPEEKTLSASSVLAAARMEMDLSQKDVADALFLSISVVRFIDDGQLDKITKKAFIKGYLRSYAKMVNLDPDGVVNLYCGTDAPEEPIVLMQTIRPDAISKISFTGPVLISGLVGLVGLIAIVVLVWYYTLPEEPVPVVTAGQGAENAILEEASEDAAFEDITPKEIAFEDVSFSESASNESASENSIAEVIVDVSNTEVTPTELPTTDSFENNVTLENEANEIATLDNTDQQNTILDAQFPIDSLQTTEAEIQDTGLIITRNSEGLNNYINVDAGGSDVLNVTFSDDCWLEVEDKNGNSIYGDLGRSGDDLTISGEAPFKILVGKPSVVSVYYEGNLIDLKPFRTPARTARLSLGSAQ